MNARDRILARLQTHWIASDAGEPDLAVHLDKQWGDDERLDKFQQMIESVHGEVIRVKRDAWAPALGQVCRDNGFERMLVGTGAIADQAADAIDGDVRRYDAPIGDWKGALFSEVDAAFTSTRGGIAETGSLVMWPTPEEPRLMSLVPPVHIALLDGKMIGNTFTEVLTQQGWADALPTNALLVSGPSKSADIAQVLAYGVHGPKRLIVLLIDD